MKATEQYLPVVLLIYYAIQGDSSFWVWFMQLLGVDGLIDKHYF